MYLFFDTETTGLPRRYRAPIEDLENWPRVVEIAWVLYSSNARLLSEHSFIIKPEGFQIPKEVSMIHGITTQKAQKEGKKLQPVLDCFAKDVKKADFVVAHNIDFDEKIISAELLRKNINHDLTTKPKICTMHVSTDFCKLPRKYSNTYKWPNLKELHIALFGSDFENCHRALADAKACAKCFFELKKQKVIK